MKKYEDLNIVDEMLLKKLSGGGNSGNSGNSSDMILEIVDYEEVRDNE